MEMSCEMEGFEFDWFATDRDGCVALFATAGSGPIPKAVLDVAEAHSAVGDSLEVTGLGTTAVWHSYSRAGLYAYDWSDVQGCYVQVAEPSAPMLANLTSAISSIPGLPNLALSFSRAAAVTQGWQGGD